MEVTHNFSWVGTMKRMLPEKNGLRIRIIIILIIKVCECEKTFFECSQLGLLQQGEGVGDFYYGGFMEVRWS